MSTLPPLPRGRRMGSGVINGKLIELFMHDDAAMTSYATAAISAQAAEVEALQAKVAEWEKLHDPVTLHVSLLRGFPARLSREVLLHLAGEDGPTFELSGAKRPKEKHDGKH